MSLYRKKQLQEMLPWEWYFDMECVSISQADRENGSPREGDMIVFGENPTDQWLIAKEFFEENYELVEEEK